MKRILNYKQASHLLVLIVAFLLGAGVHWYFTRAAGDLITEKSVRITNQYPLVSPLLICGNSERKDLGDYKVLSDKLTDIINTARDKGQLTNASVYFRDGKGEWVGINEDTSYTPASLLKVPLMIAYFKEAEENPNILKQGYTYDGAVDRNEGETFKSGGDLRPGVYTVEELIQAMIASSDNNATNILNQHINQRTLSRVYTDLGLTVPETGATTVNTITAKEYSYFFRILRNATYLSPEYSEKALELLSEPDFPQGIKAPLPSNILTAGKFGERSIFSPDGTLIKRQLHDCGIIFYPNQPYLLCVMTEGKDFDNLASFIQNISKLTYETIKNE